MLDKLGDSLKEGIRKLISKIVVDESALNEFLKDIQRALIQADVDVKLVFDLTNKIRERVKKEKAFNAREQLVRILYEELVSLLGGEGHKINIDEKPFKILLVGLFGNGKTTTAGKIAKFFKKRGNKVGLLCLDTFRAGAYEQLQQLAEKVNVKFFGIKGEKDPEKIIKKFEDEFPKFDIIIADSAGRTVLDEDLKREILKIERKFKPNEILLVLGGDIGQAAREQSQAFKEALNISGVIVTKLDGTAKGGGALTACSLTNSPVKFIGVGEHLDDIEEFEPKKFVSRMLGMGDLETLLEKAKEAMDERKMEELGKKMLKGKFNLIDLYEQLEAVKKMGSLTKIISMIPGLPLMKLPKDVLNLQQEKLKKFKYIMDSMTREELENPNIISGTRVERIAKGSGTSVQDVRDLLTQYKQMKKLMKGFGGRNLKKLMKQFKGIC